MTTPRVTVPVEPTELVRLSSETADYLLRVAEEADDNQWQDWAATMRQASQQMLGLCAMLSAAPAPEGGVVWFGAKDYEPTDAMIDAGEYHNHRHNSLTNLVASFKAMMEQAEIDGLISYAPALATREKATAEAGEPAVIKGDGFNPQGGGFATLIVDGVRYTADQVRAALSAQPQAREDAQPVGWLRAVDEEMVCAHLGVADAEDSFETAKKKLASLIQWNIAVATDPSVGGHPAPDALRVAVEALWPRIVAMEDFLNEPQRRAVNEPIEVCDYRHDAYRVWTPLCQALAALQAEQGAK